MSKYYRVLKDTFLWDKGAILKHSDNDDGYKAISDLWDAIDCIDGEYISTRNVEKNPVWFERVYEVSVLGKAKYLTKEAAKALHEELYKEK